MMNINRFIIYTTLLLLYLCFGFCPAEKGYTNRDIFINSDSSSFTLVELLDEQNLPVYFYRDIDQYPCDDSVCMRMQLRIYWDLWGNFVKIELPDNYELTKINHIPFSQKDYNRLHKLLNNPSAFIQYYKMEDLTAKESEDNYYSLDAITGATTAVTEVTYESVRGAVKTCYTLWHLVNGETKEKIRELTLENFNSTNSTLNNQSLIFQLTDKILKKQSNAEELKTILSLGNNNQSDIYYLCLLELARKSKTSDKQFYKELSSQISGHHMIDFSIYNYLTQQGFRDKTTRNFN